MRFSFVRSFRKIAQHLYLWHEAVHDNQVAALINKRVFFLTCTFAGCFFLVGIRLVDVMVCNPPLNRTASINIVQANANTPRADIVDRNGEILATHLVTASAYANPKDIIDPKEGAALLHTVLPDVPEEVLFKKLASEKSFVWIARHLTPKKQYAIQHLGIPGVYLKKDYRRVYPFGKMASHAIGFCDIDGNGISGVERHFNALLWRTTSPLKLSLDIKVQHILSDILQNTVSEFHAIGGNAIVMKVKTGEIIAMESLPNTDLNHPGDAKPEHLFNRNTLGVHEPGSIFKILNIAIALETKSATVNSLFDATAPVKIGRFTVSDFKGKNRILTLGEAFVYSSNIASIKIAQQFGGATIQHRFFDAWGLFDPVSVELSEIGRPIFPQRWTEASALSSSYGYGIAIAPLGLLRIINGVINDGYVVAPTLLYGKQRDAKQILSASTSKIVRYLMRDVVLQGTAKKANVQGYQVFGKTGTAYKNRGGQYGNDKNRPRITFFVGGFPLHNPEYIVLVMIDEPKGTEKTFGFATGGWVAAPCGGKIIERIAPLLGIAPTEENNKPYFVSDKIVTAQRFITSTATPPTRQYKNMGDMVQNLISHP